MRALNLAVRSIESPLLISHLTRNSQTLAHKVRALHHYASNDAINEILEDSLREFMSSVLAVHGKLNCPCKSVVTDWELGKSFIGSSFLRSPGIMAALGFAMLSDKQIKSMGDTVCYKFVTYAYYRIERAFHDQSRAVKIMRKEQLLKRMLCKNITYVRMNNVNTYVTDSRLTAFGRSALSNVTGSSSTLP